MEKFKMTNQKILVTGGAGFIGSEMSNQLLDAGAKVTVVDNLINGKKENYYGSRVCGPAAGNILYRALQLRGTLPFEDLDSLSGKDNLGY